MDVKKLSTAELESYVATAADEEQRYGAELEIATRLLIKDTKRCEELLLDLSARLDQADFPEIHCMVMHLQGRLHIMKGDLGEALRYHNQGAEVADFLQHPFLMGYSYNCLAVIYRKTGNHAKAIDYFKQALLIDDHPKKERLVASTYFNLSSIFHELGEVERAIEYCHKAVEMGEKVKNPLLIADCQNALGLFTNGKGDNEAAIGHYLKAMELYQQQEAFKQLNSCKTNLASTYIKVQRFDDARKVLDEALGFFEKNDIKYDTAFVYYNLGELYCNNKYDEGDEREGVMYFEKSIALCEELGILTLEYAAYEQLALIAEEREQWAEFSSHIRKHFELKEESIRTEALERANNLELQIQLAYTEKRLEIVNARHQEDLANQKLEVVTQIAQQVSHEVQNPLQFVKNFSEMNVELSEELAECLADKDIEAANDVANDLKDNSNKVRDYGIQISKIIDQLIDYSWKMEGEKMERKQKRAL